MRNLTVEQAEFNAVYVMETDGFVLDKVTARGNDEYGILAFACDHGLIRAPTPTSTATPGSTPAPART